MNEDVISEEQISTGGPQATHIDALSIGLFGLTVGALSLGLHQCEWFGLENTYDVATVWIMGLIFGGIVQVVAGMVEVRYDQQLGGTALTMYGFLWIGISTLGILEATSTFEPHPLLEVPLIGTFACFSAVMIYLTGHKSLLLCLLHIVITVTLSSVVLMKLGVISEFIPGIGHLAIGVVAFVTAMGVLINEFPDSANVPLGTPPLKKNGVHE